MSGLWETISDFNTASVVIRLVLATVMGGCIGLNRGRKRRPAGFRTHMLVCMGAALVMITNEYIALKYSLTDPARLGAQVISGIGFLGAGTIIVTRHNQVIGMTTAAGLWASACMGLAIGIGFYIGAVMAFVLIVLSIIILHRLDNVVIARSRVMDIYIELEDVSALSNFLQSMRAQGMRVSDLEIIHPQDPAQRGVAAILSVKSPQRLEHAQQLESFGRQPGVRFVDEI